MPTFAANRVTYAVELSSFEPFVKKQLFYQVFEGIHLTDKDAPFSYADLQQAKIGHILAILPNKDELTPLLEKFGSIPYTVFYYGDTHTPNIPQEDFNKFAKTIEGLARQSEYTNLLVFCNNGYQRSLPFLVYYYLRMNPSPYDGIQEAIDWIGRHVPTIQQDREKLYKPIRNLIQWHNLRG